MSDVKSQRIALVTGASRGIGRATAEKLLASGWVVAGSHRGAGVPEGVWEVRGDVTDSASIDDAFTEIEENLGPVSAVVCNAGIVNDTLAMDMDDEQFAAVLDTNLHGAFRVIRRAVKGMISQRYGRIVLVGSSAGLKGSAGQVNYAASKAGLIGMARSLSRELASRKITANVVAPGLTETDMAQALPEKAIKKLLSDVPAKRFAQPGEVASVVDFLLSDGAAYINGAVVPVDGGSSMGH